ncbi:MAG: DUF3332 domain-containing protein [Candidatus Cloacimonetes bacterium]|jgi:hypothetical protein|nr:DUF3332 domain-containing protein [Candidatus Cloacimonadota bacterium]MDD4155098.1 DUF3332 domain-containing protein [Candidatus Cloacimonadota bacterium]
MKKSILTILIISLLSLSISGCFGSFKLVGSVYDFNKGIDNKFVKSFVMWIFYIVPVYELATLGDVILLNVIEFWTDKNPMAMEEGQSETHYYAIEDKNYEVIMTKNRFDIKDSDTQKHQMTLLFDENSNCWFAEKDGVAYKITEQDEQHIKLFHPNGELLLTKNINE